MRADVAIQATGLTQRYGAREVLRNVTLVVPHDGVFCIFGPNGAGKSTLLRLLDLLELPTEGEITINGQRATPELRPALRRRMAMGFQSPYLYRSSVGANVAYGLHVRGMPRRERAVRVTKTLERLGALELLRLPAWRLSGGEGQLINVARALAVEPEILFLDEPTANLDPGNAGRVEALIREYAESHTIILVTHNLFQARRLARHSAFLFDGRLIEQGPAVEVLNLPRDERTAAFISGEIPG